MATGIALVVVGSLGPWVKAQALWMTVNRNGIDGDGRVTLVLGLLSLLVLAGVVRGGIGPRLVTLLCGAAAGIAMYSLMNLNDRLADLRSQDTPIYAEAGWGLYAVAAGGLMAGVAAWTQHRPADRAPTEPSVRTRLTPLPEAAIPRPARTPSIPTAVGKALAAGGALLAVTGVFLVAEASAWLRTPWGFSWGFWVGAISGVVVWLGAVRWMWHRAGRRWAYSLFFGGFVGLAAYVFRQNREQAPTRAVGEMPKFPTALLCGLILSVSMATIVVAALTSEGGTFYQANGTGMEPGLADGELFLVQPLDLDAHLPKRGDVVVFDPSVASDGPQIKRVVGLPGEQIAVVGGAVEIDELRLEEPYLQGQTTPCSRSEQCAMQIPNGQIYVLGDNRANSTDSRTLGPIAVERIRGRIVLTVSPLRDVRRFRSIDYVRDA